VGEPLVEEVGLEEELESLLDLRLRKGMLGRRYTGKRVGEERRANMVSLALAITDGMEVAEAEAQARVLVFRTPPALS